MIRLNCFVKLSAPSGRDTLLAHAKALVEATLANDKGCKGYDFFASTTRDDVFMFCESWDTEADLAAHSHTSHFAEHVAAIEKVATLTTEKFER